jgi:hypothetical protein
MKIKTKKEEERKLKIRPSSEQRIGESEENSKNR